LSRGKLVDEAALIHALNGGLIAGAGLDVAAEEPMSPTNPLWRAKNLIFMPHLAAMYHEYPARAAAIFNENCRRFLAGEGATMLHQVTRP
jgi:phosphoglycerate dehydrogenase-like enzyme